MKMIIHTNKKERGYEPQIYFNNNKKIVVQKTINKCNNHCIFCVFPDCFTKFEKTTFPNTQEFKKIINSYSQDGNFPNCISFTTAEPTLRTDLRALLTYTIQKYPNSEVVVLTNARRFCYKGYTSKFKRLFSNIRLEIPLHGPTADIHDNLTQINGSFDQTVNGIKNIYSICPHAKINIRVLVHKSNYKYLGKTIEFIKKEFPQINSIIMIYISMIGYAKQNYKLLLLRPKKLKTEINTILRKYGSKVNISLFHFPYCIINKEFWYMNAGRTLPEEDIGFPNKCSICDMYDKCCGFWKSEFNKELFKDIDPEYL